VRAGHRLLDALAVGDRHRARLLGLGARPRPLEPSWIWLRALLRARTCASVLTAMNSTPSTPWSIMWLTAFPPAPPTPITLMIGPVA
jgi:hypothetical protein